MPCHYKLLSLLIEMLLLVGLLYVFFLVAQICLVNPLIIGILTVWYRQAYILLEGIRWKVIDWHKTKDFETFLKDQNQKYEPCNIEILYES